MFAVKAPFSVVIIAIVVALLVVLILAAGLSIFLVLGIRRGIICNEVDTSPTHRKKASKEEKALILHMKNMDQKYEQHNANVE